MADPASSEDPTPPENKAAAGDGPSSVSAKIGGEAFANTKKHVAEQQADGAAVERFANTKLNIALINDPKNGPRFTMTKRESGLANGDEDAKAKTSSPETDDLAETTAASETAEPSPLSAAAKPKPATDRLEPSAPRTEASKPMGASDAAAAAGAKATTVEPSGGPSTTEAPDKVQVDSTKIFVGHNGTYYDESWRWMDWRGTRRSWNWPAALSFGQWFAYRRLHGYAGLYILWLAGLAACAVNNVPIVALVALVLLGIGITGLYGNTLYFFAFRQAVDHVTKTGEGDYQELQSQLAAAGGTSFPALGVMAVLNIAAIAAALAVTRNLRGGFAINFWPF